MRANKQPWRCPNLAAFGELDRILQQDRNRACEATFVKAYDRTRGFHLNHQAESGITVAIDGSTRCFGVLGAFSTRARQFGSNDVRFLQSVAKVIGLAVRNENIRQEHLRRTEQFQTAIESGHGLIMIIAPEDGRIMFASASVERVTGYRPEEVVGQTVYDFFAGNDPDRREAIRRELANPESIRVKQHTMRHRDGSERVLDTIVNRPTSLLDRRFVVLSSSDITDRIRAERELAWARDVALEASRVKSTFIANTSHEIRTPLNIILGYTEVLSDELGGDSSLRSYLEAMGRAGRRLLHTIDVILDYSKAEAGGLDLNPVEIELEPFLENLACDFDVLAAAKSLDVLSRSTPRLLAVPIAACIQPVKFSNSRMMGGACCYGRGPDGVRAWWEGSG
jgi:PAS domain S-box-containing protein